MERIFNKYLFKKAELYYAGCRDKEDISYKHLDNGSKLSIYEQREVSYILDRLKQDFGVDISEDVFIYCNISGVLKKDQEVYFFEDGDINYTISYSYPEFRICQTLVIDEIKQDLVISYDGKYRIEELITDLKTSDKSCDYFTFLDSNINRKWALSLARGVLENLLNSDFVRNNDMLSIVYQVYKHLNLLRSDYFHPAISDDILTLSSPYQEYNSSMETTSFDIILNETEEVIGDIDYGFFRKFRSIGNVSYLIREDFRRNHYATRAVSLLKRLLVDNDFEGDKSMYISTLIDNIYSQKVALNNSGVLIYEGPGDSSVRNKDVKIYKIDVPNKKN